MPKSNNGKNDKLKVLTFLINGKNISVSLSTEIIDFFDAIIEAGLNSSRSEIIRESINIAISHHYIPLLETIYNNNRENEISEFKKEWKRIKREADNKYIKAMRIDNAELERV